MNIDILNTYTPTQKEILRLIIKEKQISRSEIASLIKTSNLTVINTAKKLIADGFVVENGSLTSSRGRKAVLLSPNPEAFHFLCADIGTSSTKLAVVRFDGSYAYRTQIIHASPATVFVPYITPEILRDEIDHILMQFGPEKIYALCFSISGIVDSSNKIVRFCANISGWDNVNIQKVFGDYFEKPVFLDTSGRCYAIAEAQYNNDVDDSSLFYIAIGHGISTGLIIDGNLYRGTSGASCELGHFYVPNAQNCHNPLDLLTPNCSCGHANCLELYVTAATIREIAENRYHRLNPDSTGTVYPNTTSLRRAYSSGDSVVADTINAAAHTLGSVIANLVNMLNPKHIILGGGTIAAFPEIVEIVANDVTRFSLPINAKNVTISGSHFNIDGATLGAALLAINNMLS